MFKKILVSFMLFFTLLIGTAHSDIIFIPAEVNTVINFDYEYVEDNTLFKVLCILNNGSQKVYMCVVPGKIGLEDWEYPKVIDFFRLGKLKEAVYKRSEEAERIIEASG